MNREVRDSLDGRYFGPLPVDAVLGVRALQLSALGVGAVSVMQGHLF